MMELRPLLATVPFIFECGDVVGLDDTGMHCCRDIFATVPELHFVQFNVEVVTFEPMLLQSLAEREFRSSTTIFRGEPSLVEEAELIEARR